jgi:hypothetical protein
LAGPVPEVAGVADAIRRAEASWRAVAPAGPGPEALLRHGGRVFLLVEAAAGDRLGGLARAVAAAAVLHEIGRFVRDRGHHAVRGARWAATHLDEVLPSPAPDERRLVGELILFQRHRDALPPEISRPDLVDLFRRAERCDLSAGRDPAALPDGALARAEAVAARGPLRAALRRSDLRERLLHPLVAGRAARVRRPDR